MLRINTSHCLSDCMSHWPVYQREMRSMGNCFYIVVKQSKSARRHSIQSGLRKMHSMSVKLKNERGKHFEIFSFKLLQESGFTPLAG